MRQPKQQSHFLKKEKASIEVPAAESNDASSLRRKAMQRHLLLSINRSIATVRNKKEILQFICPKLKKLFGTEDFFICRIDKELDQVVPFLRLAKKQRAGDSTYTPLLTAHFDAKDRFFKMVLKSGKPVYLTISQMKSWKNPPGYAFILASAGIKECLSIALHNGEEAIGVLTVFSDKLKGLSKDGAELIEQLADQMTIVLTNIEDRELRMEKQRENELLLGVSHAISSIRNKHGLAQAIQRTLRSALNFSDLAITRFDLTKSTFKVFLESCETSNLHPDFDVIAFEEYPIQDGIHDTIMQSDETVVLKVQALKKDDFTHIAFLEQAGIKELAGIRLKHNDQVIGTMVLLSTEENSFSVGDRKLLREVSNHFATAMANIIYHEELEERSREKERLLMISNAFSSVHHREELLPILQEQLAALSLYSDASIAIKDKIGKTFSRFLVNENSVRQADPGYAQMRAAHHPYPDGIFDKVLHSEEPVLFDVSELMKKDVVPSYISFLHRNGTVHMAGISLRNQGKEIGVLFLFSSTKSRFSAFQLKLLRGMANRLSATIANILAQEQITRNEQEKSLLLSFSYEMASIRSKEELFRILKTKVKTVFSADGFGISLITEDKKACAAFIFDVEEKVNKAAGFSELTNQPIPLTDPVFSCLLGDKEPQFFYSASNNDKDESVVARFWKTAGMEMVVGCTLNVGEQPIGFFFLNLPSFTEETFKENLALFKGICAQLSIALSNSIANEKIVEQLHQINRYKDQLEEEKLYLQSEAGGGFTYSDIIGQSAQIQQVFQLLSQVAPTTSTVLITGETGTGKELIARAIHNTSPRKEALLVKVNCAALPPSLFESELFGHEKNSFTGATERRIGKFELANNGTLFLDEIGELPMDLQVKLLRAIQEREIERIGGRSPIKVNVRIIAATNRDLQVEVGNEKFRRDLFYRLNVFPIPLPPLRDRKEDIPLLAFHFMEKYNRTSGKKISSISSKVMKQLFAYSWPGNIRELEHLIERSVLLSNGSTIKTVQLAVNEKRQARDLQSSSYLKTFEENERDHILHVLHRCQGKIYGAGGAAEILKLKVSTLNSKMKKLGIKKSTIIQ